MAKGDIHEGDTTQFEGEFRDEDDAVIDLSALTLTSQFLRIRDHLGALSQFTTTFLNTGSDGIVKYRVANTVLKVGKRWSRQFYILVDDGQEYSTDLHYFDVKERLT